MSETHPEAVHAVLEAAIRLVREKRSSHEHLLPGTRIKGSFEQLEKAVDTLVQVAS